MAERQAKACTTGTSSKASSATYTPVQRNFGLLSFQHSDVPTRQHKGPSPMERWMNQQPNEAPYHNVGSVANRHDSWMQTAKAHSTQQTKTSSNQATVGSWGKEDLAGPTGGKKKNA
ncbi:MAG: hypothetical protein Q9198_006098 [Flavoplaca austrocitrina]